jgi:hypothetical protein
MSGSLQEGPNKTSCVLLAGAPGKCWADTQQALQMNGLAKHIKDWVWAIGFKSTETKA